jgi:hypothetical protein
VTDVSEQIKIKAVNMLFPPTSWSRLFWETPRTAHERLPKQEARQVSGATCGAALGECLSDSKQQFCTGVCRRESTAREMGTVVVTRQADVDARPRESPTKPHGWRVGATRAERNIRNYN